MKYFPYFRGKQFELICLRENANLIAASGFVPIIEPVKEGGSGLVRATKVLKEAGAQYLLVLNPSVGRHVNELSAELVVELEEAIGDYPNAHWLIQANSDEDLTLLERWLKHFPDLAVLHTGALSPKAVNSVLAAAGAGDNARINIFDDKCSARYRQSFLSSTSVLLSDGFNKVKNADYPEIEMFSDVPISLRSLGVSAYGDYLIVGREYSEGGGAAYAVAIHLTFSDMDDDGAIYVRHFVSDSNDSPLDPAGKFREALDKLVKHCNSRSSKIPRTTAVEEFIKLSRSGHFPGLGYVKKLSMQHHLEMLAL